MGHKLVGKFPPLIPSQRVDTIDLRDVTPDGKYITVTATNETNYVPGINRPEILNRLTINRANDAGLVAYFEGGMDCQFAGNTFAVVKTNESLVSVDLETGARLAEIPSNPNAIFRVSRGGNYVAVADCVTQNGQPLNQSNILDSTTTLGIYNIRTGERLGQSVHQQAIIGKTLEFSPDGRYLSSPNA